VRLPLVCTPVPLTLLVARTGTNGATNACGIIDITAGIIDIAD